MANRKGQIKLIVGLALLTLFLVIALGLFSTLFARTEGKAAEELCHTFNALTAQGGDALSKAKSIGLVPNACQTIDVEEIPNTYGGNSYGRDRFGAMGQVADLSARCWWMFLEGLPNHDVLGSKLWSGVAAGEQQCFICYTFGVDPDSSFSSEQLTDFFDSRSYTVRQDSDNCYSEGGGKCLSQCSGDLSREVDSKKCNAGEKCCVAESKVDECVNKGGKCMASCSGEYSREYLGWRCASDRCCVKSENYFTYRDYVQGFGGSGALLVEDISFDERDQYAIVFSEEPLPVLKAEYFFGGPYASYQVLYDQIFAERGIDAITITELGKIQDECLVRSGATG